MKKTTLLFFLSLFFISSFSGFSQTTLYSEDFEGGAIHGTQLNDADPAVTDHNAHSWTDQAYLYNFDDAVDSNPSQCTNDSWVAVSSHHENYGDEQSGMTGYRAGIQDGGYYCDQSMLLITPAWTAVTSTMTISFSYCYENWTWGNTNWEQFNAYLQRRSGSADFANSVTLVGPLLDDGEGNYSSTQVVIPGYEYRLVFQYKHDENNYGYGASVDTILVQHPDLGNLTVSSDTTISDAQEYYNVTVNASRTLTIAKTGTLIVTNDIANSGTIVLESDADEFSSIKYQGSSTDETITYKRYVNHATNNEWDLIGSPVDDLSISSFATTNTTGTAILAEGDGGSNGASGEYAIGDFDNSDNTWTNYTTGTVGAAGNLDIGKGYAMGSVSGGTGLMVFTGDIAVVDISRAIIAQNSGTNRWNLIANPFPSFINANDDAHATNNFLTVNAAQLHDTYEAVYGWDADTSGYTAYNHSSPGSAVYIAPGQGFMVASASTISANVTFTEKMQTVNGTDDFIDDVLNDVFEVSLRLYHGDQEIAETRLYFEDGLGLGLNPGYDAGAFDQNAALMTRLVEDDEGHGLAINAMSTEDMDDVVIPLEINQTAGQEFRINLHTSTIGEVNIYLEDTELQTLTLLNDEDFVMTPTYDLSDVGRFYVHLTANTLSGEEVNTSLLNAYKEVNANYITIEGLATQATSTKVSLYNITGTKVMDITLDNTANTQTISTNRFATGIYVLKLISGKNQLTKKLIIK